MILRCCLGYRCRLGWGGVPAATGTWDVEGGVADGEPGICRYGERDGKVCKPQQVRGAPRASRPTNFRGFVYMEFKI